MSKLGKMTQGRAVVILRQTRLRKEKVTVCFPIADSDDKQLPEFIFRMCKYFLTVSQKSLETGAWS